MEAIIKYLILQQNNMFQKLTPELRKKIEDSGLPLVKMTMEQFKSSLGQKSNKKPKTNK